MSFEAKQVSLMPTKCAAFYVSQCCAWTKKQPWTFCLAAHWFHPCVVAFQVFQLHCDCVLSTIMIWPVNDCFLVPRGSPFVHSRSGPLGKPPVFLITDPALMSVYLKRLLYVHSNLHDFLSSREHKRRYF